MHWRPEPILISWAVAFPCAWCLRWPPPIGAQLRRFCVRLAGGWRLLTALTILAAMGAAILPWGWLLVPVLGPLPILVEAGKLHAIAERLGTVIHAVPEAEPFVAILLPETERKRVVGSGLAEYFPDRGAAVVPWRDETIREIDSLGLWPWTIPIGEEAAKGIGAIGQNGAKTDESLAGAASGQVGAN